MRAKQYRYTVEDIARLAERSVASVYKDIQRGKLNPENLRDVVRYIREA